MRCGFKWRGARVGAAHMWHRRAQSNRVQAACGLAVAQSFFLLLCIHELCNHHLLFSCNLPIGLANDIKSAHGILEWICNL